ncbi:MAG: glutamate 5-kinase [Chloroflexota bacterium]|jgi:glutamate 5-kinase|nr:MAG: glutamate 5-kinase [Chloroflexota bacterium]
MRIVVKLGTSTLTGGARQLNRQRMLEIVQQVARLYQEGREMVVVSSGAVTAGRERLGFPDLGRSVPAKQMLSAVGQGRLMHLYGELFDIFEIAVGQVLLTRDDLADRPRYLNARDTLLTLIERRIVPIINENDTIATDEIRVGDNDNLSALVANLLEADLLVILTDQPGLFTADPRRDSGAQLIQQVRHIDEQMYALAGGAGSNTGTGGMVTKIQAAQLASRSGVTTVIASGKEPDVLARIIAGEPLGTRFEPVVSHLEGRKRWLLADKPRGRLYVDAGAANKLLKGGASLLPVGITGVEGAFERGETVAVFAPDGREIAHGLTSYSSADVLKLRGIKSAKIAETLGYTYGDAVIHRNNLVVLV